jgi:hypothetical protein
MAIESICEHCDNGTVYNDAGYPDRPREWQCDQCWGHGRFLTFTHKACGSNTTVPGANSNGCTFDCACGRTMLIEGDEAVDLHDRMVANIREQYGVEVNSNDFGYIEL